MFNGSLPSDAINIICKEIKKWNKDDKCNKLYIGCSGNFTLERSLSGIWDKEVISNDVTIYSCVLGWYFSNSKINIKFKDEYNGFFRFVEKYMNTEEEKLACILILSDALKYEVPTEKMTDYNRRMLDAYKDQWNIMFSKTLEKISKKKESK